jgi:hypothetical protein
MTFPEDERYARYSDPETGRPDPGLFAQAVLEDAKAWFEAQKELATLTASEKAGRLAGMVIVFMVLFFFVSAAFLMASVALAIWFGGLIGSTALGFLTAGGLYLLFGVIFYGLWNMGLRDRLILAIINAVHGTH